MALKAAPSIFCQQFTSVTIILVQKEPTIGGMVSDNSCVGENDVPAQML